MSEFTSQDAIEFAEKEKWRDMTYEQRAKFQMSHGLSCMPFDKFHEAVEKTLDRPVYTHEFGLNWEGLKSELFDGKEPPSMEELIDMLPPDKTMVVVTYDVGDVVSRDEALEKATEIGEQAEQERSEVAEEEAKRGIQYDD